MSATQETPISEEPQQDLVLGSGSPFEPKRNTPTKSRPELPVSESSIATTRPSLKRYVTEGILVHSGSSSYEKPNRSPSSTCLPVKPSRLTSRLSRDVSQQIVSSTSIRTTTLAPPTTLSSSPLPTFSVSRTVQSLDTTTNTVGKDLFEQKELDISKPQPLRQEQLSRLNTRDELAPKAALISRLSASRPFILSKSIFRQNRTNASRTGIKKQHHKVPTLIGAPFTCGASLTLTTLTGGKVSQPQRGPTYSNLVPFVSGRQVIQDIGLTQHSLLSGSTMPLSTISETSILETTGSVQPTPLSANSQPEVTVPPDSSLSLSSKVTLLEQANTTANALASNLDTVFDPPTVFTTTEATGAIPVKNQILPDCLVRKSRLSGLVPLPLVNSNTPSSFPSSSSSSLQEQVVLESLTVLTEINTDDKDKVEENGNQSFKKCRWMNWNDIHVAFEAQLSVNPEDIFGPLPTLDIEQVMFKQRTRRGKQGRGQGFRPRNSSACWTGQDLLTVEEVVEYVKDMGWK